MFIRFRNISNFSDFYLFYTSLFNIYLYLLKIIFFKQKIHIFWEKKSFLTKKTVPYRIFKMEISEKFGMVPIVFTFPENFEP